jgi:hypothetical protein
MERRRVLVSLFAVCASVAVTACSDEDGAPADDVESAITSQVFSGRVLTGEGAAIAGARVTINGITRVTGSSGQYAMSVVDSRTGYKFDIRKDGFGPLTEFRLGGALSLVHRLQAGFTKVIEPGAANVIIEPSSGVRVTLPANSLRSNNGAPVGTVRFTILPHTSQTMPGDFTARRADGRDVALISVGAATLQAVDAQNNTLGLAPGAALGVRIPVPAAAGGSMPDCVLSGDCRAAIWRFDRPTGLWIEQPAAAPAFGGGATQFNIRGAQKEVIDPADGLGTWNADIEFVSPACTVIEFAGVPLECYNPPPGVSPEPGIETSFTQALSGGGTKSKTSAVLSSAAFLILYNLRPSVPIDLSFVFPPGAPAGCAANLVIGSNPPPNPGFPVAIPGGGATQLDTGAPWGGTGYPTNSGGLPVSFADVVIGDHPCNSTVLVTTAL